MSNVKALGNGTPNLGIDTLVDSGSTEPFTLISNDISIPPTDSSSSTLGYTNGKRGRRNPITRKESYASLKKSRTSLELIRNKIGESMATRSDDKIHLKRINRTTKNSILHSGRDRYGFKKANNHISEGEYDNWWVSYSQYLIKRKKKWEKMMAKNGLPTANNVAPTRFPPRSESLRKFVRKGIPAEWRGNAWFYFARGSEKLRENKDVYDRLVDQTMDIINENTEAIEKDLHRTFPENIHFKNIRIQQANGEVIEEESPLLQTLRRVLKCFSLYRPSIGYCQSLNFIAGLLLIYMDEERAFWMLVIISERYLPGIHDFNLEGVNVHQGVLLLCLRQYLPDVWGMIVDKNDVRYQEGTNAFLYDLPALSFCTTSWFMSIFIGVLPTETTLRVWDCLFYEDSKTIFQIALTIFKMMEPELHRIADRDTNEDEEFLSSELFQVIQNFPKKLLDVNRMMEECFRFSNFSKLTQDEVVKCKQYVIESRSRYHNLIKKRSAIGLKESDRKELIKSSETLENKKIGLKALNWNGKLNHRMRRLRHKLR
ncbi:DEKNAAC102700 [Brettanomyces naardenensis]|uniref:DEKNAAC102700 n=1 Tax=Brettanomyces naardenensis TaxID=13370 RepID=A0A448YL34_BRENA|nr:DEKNAAC102700 [Brettanomyces naardenensis]